MSLRFSLSYFCCCCCLCFFFVVSLFHLCLSNKSFDDDVLCIEGERQALLRFKHGLVDEAGRLASWDDGKESDCCKWVGIGCDNTTGHVHRIHLPGVNGHCYDGYNKESLKQRLGGKLSSSLLHLKQLRHLDLSCNDFGGIQVPEFIGSLRNLGYLNLSYSEFGGIIPPQFGNLSELHHLDMSHVDLRKAIDWLEVINTIPSLVQLHLSSCQLSNIHPHVASVNLTSLSLLDLSLNNFDSPLSKWIFSITSLVSLDLRLCNFNSLISGSIYTFRNLTSLESLNVGGNKFMNSSLVLGDLSSTIGGNLISLEMNSCGISNQVLNSLHNLTSLLSLDLSDNQLTKKIPKSLGYNVCNLIDLDLSRNKFGNISLTSLLESVFRCKSPHLESISLSELKLSGTISDSIGRLSFLRSLVLTGNLFSGPIPSAIGQLSLLEMLLLSHNQLNGNLPDSIGQLSSLEVLDLSGNRISGTIPDSIGWLSLLEELSLAHNRLNGGLPTSLGQLSKLNRLDVYSNLLTGVVTEAHFSKLVSLKRLYGDGNNLSLRLQLTNWIPPFQLEILYLNSWGLGPQFPLWLQSQNNLTELDISNTGISSLPPESFWRSLPNVRYLDMSQNHIQGTLKLSYFPARLDRLDLSSNKLTGELTTISNLSLPQFLDLSNNLFAGSLHDFLCSNGVKETDSLSLGNNYLSGDIPECWDKWPHLEFLKLENNNFCNGIPTTLGSLFNLKSLNMRGNKLSGRLPVSLMNLTGLEILQLDRNELEGSIPSLFGTELSHLRLLNLRSNNFDGSIPHELCYLKDIQILNLAHNNLSGSIPICFNNFSVFTSDDIVSRYRDFIFGGHVGSDSLVMKGREDTYSTILGLVMLLDLSSNNLVGHIPSELTSLKALQSLNLSGNRLTGRIPEKIGDMKALISVDLSMNLLFGELPVSLSRLNFLSSFNVSYNNLTGKVPSGTQLQTLNESSFFGNKLCGPPLTESCAVEIEVPDTKEKKEEDGADWGLIISGVLGFVSGFWIILVPLIFSRSWRITYFGFLSKVRYMVLCRYA